MKTEQEIEVLLCTNTLDITDVIERVHIIVGPNGKCMCGGPYASEMLTCSQILSRLSGDAQRALVALGFGGERIKATESTSQIQACEVKK